ncbi:serine/threonine-protein phosphatase 6 regulatory ankyrin repeat subunit A-like [Mytilus trossulus]|uniref:serine/threonine-protein phosphatase 6 regulatory ankyrin repeat subunit A-like n=1 Tax=Mytilus trossulus TaxID=6551 RepID=UPI003007584C
MLIKSCNQNDDNDENDDSISAPQFIITCRENIFAHNAFPKLTCFSLVQCSFSTEYKITPEERRTIALSYLPEKTVNNIENIYGNTPLYVSSHLGYLDFVEYFIVKSPNHIEVKDKEGRSPFYVACEKVHIAVVRYLMKYNQDINAENLDKTTALNGNEKLAKLLLFGKYNVDISNRDTFGLTALHSACKNGHTEIVKAILEFDSNVNEKDENGSTPLFLACLHGCYDTVKFLLDLNGKKFNSRVDTTIKDEKGCSALHAACLNPDIEVAKLLIDVGMNINDTTNSGSTPLHNACQQGHYETVKLLVDLNGQALNSRVHTTVKDDKGLAALHLACQNGHKEVIKLLIDVGMNINDTTNRGSTPLLKTCQRGHYETVKFLLDLNRQVLNSRVDTTIKTFSEGQGYI